MVVGGFLFGVLSIESVEGGRGGFKVDGGVPWCGDTSVSGFVGGGAMVRFASNGLWWCCFLSVKEKGMIPCDRCKTAYGYFCPLIFLS